MEFLVLDKEAKVWGFAVADGTPTCTEPFHFFQMPATISTMCFCESNRLVDAMPNLTPVKKPPIMGTWPPDDLRRAFVEGAAWWEMHQGGTMQLRDRHMAELEAETRFPHGKRR